MREHHHHWRDWAERHARRGWGHERDGHRGWGGRHGFGGGRFFEQGDLRFVILALVAEKPRHGYDLIKEIEQRLGGAYAPSPGVIYPLLTMLEEMGHVTLASSEGGKKLYAITPNGEAELKENDRTVSALFERIDAVRDRFSGGRSPQVVRAMENLRYALRLRFEHGPLTDEQAQAIAAALDAAAQAVERV
ncbi:MAG TPA: PadR family transcriptional regulator [Caulobacterales bacterium]|nr:PadR family transcriptional regulator [Caulobacterales bacterium]